MAVPAGRGLRGASSSSRVADADNAGGGPGAIIAALFLQHFAGDVPWAHLDLASTGDAPADCYEWTKGPTGFGARLLLDWLGSPDPLAGIGDRRQGMNGLTVRWSLADAPAGVEEALASYVAETSHARFSVHGRGCGSRPGGCVPGEWFEGCYVFADDAARAAFQETFTAGAAESPGSQIIGSPPILIEPCAIVAVAEGGDGLRGRAASGVSYSDSGVHSFLASSSPSPTGSSTGTRPSSAPTSRTSSRIASVSSSRSDGSATRSCHSALSKATTPPGRSSRSASLEVGGVLGLVAVDEDEVVVAVGEPGEHVERGAGDGAGALGRDAGLGERLAGQPLVLGLDVDRGQDAVGAHAAQQPEPGDAGAGADLDHRAGLETEARKRSAAPPPEPIATTPTSSARSRARARTSSSATKASA